MRKVLLVCLTVFLLHAPLANAESLMYMDNGGNIYFAQSYWEVPPQYRHQVRPSPTPMTLKEWKKANKKFKKKQAEKKKKKKKKKKKNWVNF